MRTLVLRRLLATGAAGLLLAVLVPGAVSASGASVSAVALSVPAVSGVRFDGVVATFTASGAGPFSATIDWGDGSSGAGSIAPSGSGYAVSGSHTYAHEGIYTVLVRVSDPDGTDTAVGSAVVADAPLTAVVAPPRGVEGASFDGVVATFADEDAFGVLGDYSATIDWGDGRSSPGTIAPGAGDFTVSGAIRWGEEGRRTLTVTVTDKGGAVAIASAQVEVADAPLYGFGKTISVRARRPFSRVVATFDDVDRRPQHGPYGARISWGDGRVSRGRIGTGAKLTVIGGHTYARRGVRRITVAIRDAGGAVAVARGIAAVS